MVRPQPHPNWLHGWIPPLLIPWFTVGVASLYGTYTGIWHPIEIRIMHVVGATLASAVLFAVARPWRYCPPDRTDE